MTDYGTVNYYSEMFSDILADCATGREEEDMATIKNIMSGFEQAIMSWMNYHEDARDKYQELHRRFMTGDLDW